MSQEPRRISGASASLAEDLQGFITASRPFLVLISQDHPNLTQGFVQRWFDFFARAVAALRIATPNAEWIPVQEAGQEVETAANLVRHSVRGNVWDAIVGVKGETQLLKLEEILRKWDAWWAHEKN